MHAFGVSKLSCIYFSACLCGKERSILFIPSLSLLSPFRPPCSSFMPMCSSFCWTILLHSSHAFLLFFILFLLFSVSFVCPFNMYSSDGDGDNWWADALHTMPLRLQACHCAFCILKGGTGVDFGATWDWKPALPHHPSLLGRTAPAGCMTSPPACLQHCVCYTLGSFLHFVLLLLHIIILHLPTPLPFPSYTFPDNIVGKSGISLCCSSFEACWQCLYMPTMPATPSTHVPVILGRRRRRRREWRRQEPCPLAQEQNKYLYLWSGGLPSHPSPFTLYYLRLLIPAGSCCTPQRSLTIVACACGATYCLPSPAHPFSLHACPCFEKHCHPASCLFHLLGSLHKGKNIYSLACAMGGGWAGLGLGWAGRLCFVLCH